MICLNDLHSPHHRSEYAFHLPHPASRSPNDTNAQVILAGQLTRDVRVRALL
jgi:hypothetical protein